MKRIRKRMWVATLGLLIICNFEMPMDVKAENTNASVLINGGLLEFSAVPVNVTFNPVTLNGIVQIVDFDFTGFSVTDARGTGVGWKMQVSASQFAVDATKKLPIGSLSLKPPSGFTAGYDNPSPSPTVGGTYSVPQVIDGQDERVIVTAVADAGMGKWNINWDEATNNDLTLTLNPATTKVGNYVSTITWTLSTGPEI